MKTILYFQSVGKVSTRQKLEGTYAYARAHNWSVQVIEPGATPRKANELVRFWSPDGVIVECGAEQNHFDPTVFDKTPVVFLDRNPKTLDRHAFFVTHDSLATVRLVARELLSLKLASYGYVPWPEPRFWSEERERGFAEALRLNDRGYVRFDGKARSSDVRALQQQLAQWLGGLPKPAGIFAANDFMAAQVLSTAARIGIGVPDDLAVVGVDNDELLCENARPSLSSVMPDFRTAGEKAAELLDMRMSNGLLKPKSLYFGPLQLVRRTSTNRFKRVDKDVLAALDLIRREACNGLKARAVFALFRCSRRMAEMRFRAATGTSPLKMILEIRRTRAVDLMRDPSRNRDMIANLCGYSSANALANFLRKA